MYHSLMVRLVIFFIILYNLVNPIISLSQDVNLITSASGNLNSIKYTIDKEDNVISLLGSNYLDSLWINDKFYDQLKVKATNRITDRVLFVGKQNKISGSFNSLQLTGILLGLDIGVDSFGNAYFCLFSGSDSLYFDHELKIDSNYKNSILLIKVNSDLKITKVKIFKGNIGVPYKPKIIISNQSVTLISSFKSGALIIDNDTLMHSPFEDYDSFICRFNLGLDTIKYFIGMQGSGNEFIFDAIIDKSDQIYFSGYSSSYKELKIGEKILEGVDLKYYSRLVIGKLNSKGILDWLIQAHAKQGDNLISIKLLGLNELYIAGNIFSPNVEIDSQLIVNQNYDKGGITSFLIKSDTLGNLITTKDFSNYGQIEIHDTQIDSNKKRYAYFSIRDSLLFNNVYYIKNNTAICEINDSLNITNVDFISDSDGSGILNAFADKNKNIYVSIIYSNDNTYSKVDTLFYNKTQIIDLNSIGKFKFVLLKFNNNIIANVLTTKSDKDQTILFPNPSTGLVNFSNKFDLFDSFEIIDLQGNIISRKSKLTSKDHVNDQFYIDQEGFFHVNFYKKNKYILSKKILIIN